MGRVSDGSRSVLFRHGCSIFSAEGAGRFFEMNGIKVFRNLLQMFSGRLMVGRLQIGSFSLCFYVAFYYQPGSIFEAACFGADHERLEEVNSESDLAK